MMSRDFGNSEKATPYGLAAGRNIEEVSEALRRSERSMNNDLRA